MAALLGYPVERIAKTLALKSIPAGTGQQGQFCLATLSANRRIDLARLAPLVAAKRLTLASPNELAATLGFPPLGVSPLGTGGGVPVFLDRALTQFPTILVGAGVAGVEVELKPEDLIVLSGAKVADL